MTIANCKSQIDWLRAKPAFRKCRSFALCVLLLSHFNTTGSAAGSSIESQPYGIRIQIGFGSSPQFDDDFRHRVLEQVSQGIERYVGEFWQCDVAAERGQVFSGLAALERLESGAALQNAFPAEVHKVYLLQLEAAGAGFQTSGREWDMQVRQLGLMATREVHDRREVSESMLALVNELFRPVAEIERTRSGATTLHIRGGRFHPPDPLWQPLSPKKLFEVFYCFLDKDQAVERVQQVPWTYIAAGEQVEDGRTDGTVTSGLRAPLGARRRILTLALAINGRSAGTKLTLMTRAPARKLLGGVEVELSPVANPARAAGRPPGERSDDGHPDLEPTPEKNPRLVTDRNGNVFVSAASVTDGRPVWLLVHSGPVLLARVPFVPGVHSAETLELPDDTLRLEVEGDVALVQAKLVDTVARRAVLMALAKNRAKASEWEAMEGAWKELKELRPAASFVSDIGVIRIRGVKAARARRDQTTEQRVLKLCSETLELVTNYLDEDKLAEFRNDLDDLRRIELEQTAIATDAASNKKKPEPVKKNSSKKKKAPAATPTVPPSAMPGAPAGAPPGPPAGAPPSMPPGAPASAPPTTLPGGPPGAPPAKTPRAGRP